MKPAYCYKQLKTGSVRFPRTDFVARCAPQKVIPVPTNVFVTNIGDLPVRLFFTFNYPMKGSDYFNFLIRNLTNRTSVTQRYQPAPIYNIGGLIVENQYTIAVQAVIDGIPREFSIATEPFSPGYGILQFTKRHTYAAQVDSVLIPDLIPGGPPIGYIAQRTASAICIDRQNNLVLVLADGITKQGYMLKYTNTGTRVFSNAITLPTGFTPYAVTTDSNSDIYIAGYDTTDYSFVIVVTPGLVKLSGVDGSLLKRSSNNDLAGGYFTGITLTTTAIFLCGFTVSDVGIVQSFVLSKDLNFGDLALDIRPSVSDPDTGYISVARGICIDSLGRPIVVGYIQTPDQATTQYFMGIYEPTTLQRVFYFTNGAEGKQTVGESVALCPDGSVVICGSTTGQLDNIGFVGSGGENAFVSKYNFSIYTTVDDFDSLDEDLPLVWTKRLGSTDPGTSTHALAVAVDSLGGVYAVGETSGGIAPFSQTGDMGDLFVVKYNASGTQKYINQNGSTNFLPFLSATFANSVAINSYNDFFIGGVSDGIRYDEITNPAGTYVPSIFVSKYSATL